MRKDYISPIAKKIFASALAAMTVFTGVITVQKASAAEILPSDSSIPSSGCTFLGIEGRYIAHIQESIDLINEIRLEACQQGVENPSTHDPLTISDYYPIQWSSDLEYIARLRAAEASVTRDHARTNGESIWFNGLGGISSCNEVIAWNGGELMVGGIIQWYQEKDDWVNKTGGVTGHYTAMINPKNRYVGLGTFYSEITEAPNTTVGEFCGARDNVDTSRGISTGTVIQTLEVKNDKISYDLVNDSDSLSVSATVTFKDYWSKTVTTSGLTLLGNSASNISWSSSNSNVVTVSDGKLTYNAPGTATIRATLNLEEIMNKKKFLSSVLAAALALGTTTAYAQENGAPSGTAMVTSTAEVSNAQEDTYSDGVLVYTELSDGTYEVSGVEDKTLTSADIPSKVNGKDVVHIHAGAFRGCTDLVSVTIPDTVVSMGGGIFSGCTSLTEINVDQNNNEYCSVNGVMYNKNKTSLILYPMGNSSKSYIIPEGVEYIDAAFENCTYLTSVTIPNSVRTIHSYAFHGCENLVSVTIPYGVMYIESRTFDGCANLSSVIIPESVVSIGNSAFEGCNSLTRVNISANITSIGNRAFDSCKSLTEINVDENNKNYCSVNGVLFNKDKTKLLQYPIGSKADDYTIPDSVININEYAFQGSLNLVSVKIPNGVTDIGRFAFGRCANLVSITVPTSVKSIDEGTFYGCTGLTSVSIPNSVIDIGRRAFKGCTSLGSVSLPESIVNISEQAFGDCTSLGSVLIPESVESIASETFTGCESLKEINVNINNKKYCSVNGVLLSKDKTVLLQYPSGNRAEHYSIPDYVTNIGDNAFEKCTNLSSVTIPSSVVNVGQASFSDCINLASVSIPDSVMDIGYYAFAECSALTSVTIPESVTSIGIGAFYVCSGLTSVTIPDSVTSIRYGAFYDCKNLKDVYYSGSEEQWKKVSVENDNDPFFNNDPLFNATIHYNSTSLIGTPVEVTIKAPDRVDVSGQTATVTVNNETKTITIANGLLDVSGLADGNYAITFSAKNCAPRAYNVTVTNGAANGLDGGVKLYLLGDINGDGSIKMADVRLAFKATRNSSELTEYQFAVADASKDGSVKMADVRAIYKHTRGESLWS